MLFSVALALGLIAPRVALAPQYYVAQAAPGTKCSREVTITKEATPSESLPAGKVVVDVSVSSTGAVTGEKIAQSSGNATLDRAVMKLAKTSTYEAAMRNCKPVSGAYQFMFISG